MVHSQHVQHGCVHVVVGQHLLLGLVAEFVSGADRLAAANARTGHPSGHRVRVVVPAQPALRNGHAPELRVPDHQRIVQQPAPLQILEQSSDGLVDLARVQSVVLDQVAVRIPRVDVLLSQRTAVELHEAHPALDQPSRQQALPPERLRDRIVHAVQGLRLLGFLGDVDRFRSAALHPVGELVGGNSRRQLGRSRMPLGVFLVQLRQMIQAGALLLLREQLARRT